MTNEEALKMAKDLKFAITSRSTIIPWVATQNVVSVHNGEVIRGNEAAVFMLLLLNTFIDVQNSLSKSLEDNKDLQDTYRKYGEPFVHALQKSAEEHSHNFVQQWLDQHENDDKHLIDFGPTNKGTKKRTVKIDPAGETQVDDDPEESEEDVPQIVINIGELNINLNGDV